MEWTEDFSPHFQLYDPHAFQILPWSFTSYIDGYSILFAASLPPGTEPHYGLISPTQFPQHTTILQQHPAAMMPPSAAATIRPSGHVKEDLVELMMIQNAQMHQVIMNNMTMSALGSFGHPAPPSGPEAPRAQDGIQENEADPQVYHHYYQPAPYPSYPAWLLQPHAAADFRADSDGSASPPRPQHRDRPVVPPPCPPNAADVAPAAESNSAAEAEEAEERRG